MDRFKKLIGDKVKKKNRSNHKKERQDDPQSESLKKAFRSNSNASKVCIHLDEGIDLAIDSSRIVSTQNIRCAQCRLSVTKREEILQSEQEREKVEGSLDTRLQPSTFWVCLKCGYCSCGGTDNSVTLPGHSKIIRHPLVIQFENFPPLWCFRCKNFTPVKIEECVENKDLPANIQTLIEEWPPKEWIPQPIKRIRGRGYVIRGMANLGDTCFLNSILQNLLTVNILRAYFLDLEENAGPLHISLKSLYMDTSLETCFTYPTHPGSLYQCVWKIAPKFGKNQQQDSHELLLVLLNGLHKEELSRRKQKSNIEDRDSTNSGLTFVESIFQGQLSSTVTCMVCKKSSTVFETFFDLSLPVPKKKRSLKDKKAGELKSDRDAKSKDTDHSLSSGWMKELIQEDFFNVPKDDVDSNKRAEVLSGVLLNYLDDMEKFKVVGGDDVPRADDVATVKAPGGDDLSKVDDVTVVKDPVGDAVSQVEDMAINKDFGGGDLTWDAIDDSCEAPLFGYDPSKIFRATDVSDWTFPEELSGIPGIAEPTRLQPSADSNEADAFGQTVQLFEDTDECDTDEVDDSSYPVWIETCLKAFTESEVLFNNCEKCNEDVGQDIDGTCKEIAKADEKMEKNVNLMRDATKRFLINKAPPILIIHLKRFNQDAEGRLRKIQGRVVFTDILDLGPYMDPSRTETDKVQYRLIGVVEHTGTMKHGHCVAYVRGRHASGNENEGDEATRKWYRASDADITEKSLRQVLLCEAYILFYQRHR